MVRQLFAKHREQPVSSKVDNLTTTLSMDECDMLIIIIMDYDKVSRLERRRK